MQLAYTLIRQLLPDGRGFISITGGGGKTTLLSLLGRSAASMGLSVLMTTTTKVASPRLHDYGADAVFGDESVLSFSPCKGSLVFYAEHHTMDMKKWIAPREEVLTALAGRYDVVLSEADGSRGLPLKIHTERDPVIHPLTDATIAVMGLWGIGEKVCYAVFGDDGTGIVDKEYIQHYINDPEGLMKGCTGRSAIVFNGADSAPTESIAMLKDIDYPDSVFAVAASEKEDRIYGIIRGCI